MQPVTRPAGRLSRGTVCVQFGHVEVRPLVGVGRVLHDGAAAVLLELLIGFAFRWRGKECEPGAVGRQGESVDGRLMRGDLPRLAAVGPDPVDLPLTVPGRTEGEPLPAGMPGRGVVEVAHGQAARVLRPAVGGHDPHIGGRAVRFHVRFRYDERDPGAVGADLDP